jgi:hypothetical protein
MLWDLYFSLWILRLLSWGSCSPLFDFWTLFALLWDLCYPPFLSTPSGLVIPVSVRLFPSPRLWSSCSPTTCRSFRFSFLISYLLRLWSSCSPTFSLPLDIASFCFTLGSSRFVVQLRSSSDTRGRISILNFDAFRGSVQSTNRQTTIRLVSVQHASLVTTRRRFSASNCRFAFAFVLEMVCLFCWGY